MAEVRESQQDNRGFSLRHDKDSSKHIRDSEHQLPGLAKKPGTAAFSLKNAIEGYAQHPTT